VRRGFFSSTALQCSRPAYNSQLCNFDEQVPGALHHQLQHLKEQINDQIECQGLLEDRLHKILMSTFLIHQKVQLSGKYSNVERDWIISHSKYC
jgi:hypothetical protein